jgi:hypothetical protein
MSKIQPHSWCHVEDDNLTWVMLRSVNNGHHRRDSTKHQTTTTRFARSPCTYTSSWLTGLWPIGPYPLHSATVNPLASRHRRHSLSSMPWSPPWARADLRKPVRPFSPSSMAPCRRRNQLWWARAPFFLFRRCTVCRRLLSPLCSLCLMGPVLDVVSIDAIFVPSPFVLSPSLSLSCGPWLDAINALAPPITHTAWHTHARTRYTLVNARCT